MIKQYVNLPEDAAQHHGSSVSFEVPATDLAAPEEAVAHAEWWVEPVPNLNEDPRYLSAVSRAHMRREQTRNQHDVFRNTLLLPPIGGDAYHVKCSKRGDRSNPVEHEEIETWRKLYYTVHHMNNDCRDFFNTLKDAFEYAFEEAFIELELVSMAATLVDEPRTRATNALTHLYATSPRLADRPFHLRLVVLNDIYATDAGRYDEVTSDSIYIILTDRPLADDHPIRSVRARVVGQHTWRTMTSHTSVTGEDELTIRLEDHAQIAAGLDAGSDIQVQVSVTEREHYLGHSIGNFCCVRINEEGTLEDRQVVVLQTLTHEVGHGCQQVVERERIYDEDGASAGWEINALWHDDAFGGTGTHCANNAMLAPSAETSSGQTYVHQAGILCTMFFRDDENVDNDGKFCNSCLERLTRVDLGATQMQQQGWNRY
ncbi:MAG: hypothetical protein V1774_03500 [Candidatus Eisenbacteria bacterium]